MFLDQSAIPKFVVQEEAIDIEKEISLSSFLRRPF